MKLLKCRNCNGEIDIVNNERAIIKKVRCTQCGFNNEDQERKGPEIIIIRKRTP